jgi:hypothetical protein
LTNKKPDPGQLPYQEITDDSYAREAAPTFRLEEPRPGVRVLRGQCPRCDAIIDIPVMPTVFDGNRWSITGLFHRDDSKTGEADPVEHVLCTCDAHDHPGRPEGRKGCGAYWNFVIRTASA